MAPPVPRFRDQLAALDLDRSWMARGACAGWPENLWAPTTDSTRIARATAICADCPVSEPCRLYGAASGSPGVWGGAVIGMPIRSHP